MLEVESKYIAFFDLDGTIVNANSGELLARLGYNYGLMNRIELLNGIYLSILYKYNLRDTLKIIDKMVKWFAGVSEKTIVELSEEILNKYLLESIRWEIWSELKLHKERNAETVILSSSIFPICRAIANHLEMDNVICSNLEVVDGFYTGIPEGHICFGDEKLNRLKEYCKIKNSSPEDAWYYADSISDLSALNGVGHPVCINPDKKLEKIAIKKGWVISIWH
jgi:HAD superfamily hydrolase (TIGR01490 family)